jgi:hypothetical protein
MLDGRDREIQMGKMERERRKGRKGNKVLSTYLFGHYSAACK